MSRNRHFWGVTVSLAVIQILYLLDVAPLALVLLGVFIGWVLVFDKNVRGPVEKLLLLCIYTLPFSFIGLDGRPYDENPLSIFNLIFLSLLAMLGLSTLFAKSARADFLTRLMYVCVLSMLIGIGFSYESSVDKTAWVTAAATMSIYLLFPLLAIGGGRIRDQGPDPVFFIDAFQFTVLSIAIVVLLQKGLFTLGFQLGNVEILFTRISFVALLADRSQASVLLAAGAALFFIRANRRDLEGVTPFVAWTCVTLCLLASAATSARAGVVSFALCLAFLILTRQISFGRMIPAVVGGGLAGLLAVEFIFAQRNLLGGTLLHAYYRAPQAVSWLENFWNQAPLSLFSGLGLGSKNHELFGGIFTPHNIILEALANGGIWMIVFLLFPAGMVWVFRRQPLVLAGLVTILIGGMVSPSMFVSRFFPVYLLIGLITYWQLGRARTSN